MPEIAPIMPMIKTMPPTGDFLRPSALSIPWMGYGVYASRRPATLPFTLGIAFMRSSALSNNPSIEKAPLSLMGFSLVIRLRAGQDCLHLCCRYHRQYPCEEKHQCKEKPERSG